MSLTIEHRRAGRVETRHPVSAALCDGERIAWSVGPDLSSYWRSACKSVQLTTAVELLSETFSDEELALGGASHSGQPAHVAGVRALLARFGLEEDALRCGAHWPMHESSARALTTISSIHNNCSGKHTFMLAAAARHGWERDYRPPDHPLQVKNRARLAEWGGVEPEVGVDGCGVPTFWAPLSSMARTFARLAAEMRGDSVASRIGWAMNRQPFLVSGDGRLDLAVTRGATEPLAVKVGAEGLFCIAVPNRGWGIAVKVHTGNNDALAVAVWAVLDEVLPGLLGEDWPWGRVKNVVGDGVGERVAVRG